MRRHKATPAKAYHLTVQRLVSLLTALLLSVVYSVPFPLKTSAQSTPGIKTDRAVYPEPPLPALPAKGGKFNDPVFGTQIMRATDESDWNWPGCGTFYSHWPTFNANNTRLLIRCGDSGNVLIKSFDPATFTLGTTIRNSPTLQGGVSLDWQGATWSRTDPDLIYVHVSYYDANYPATGMKLYTYRPSTDAFTLLKDFAPQLSSPGQPDYLFEMHVDAQDEIFTMMHKRVGQYEPLYYIVWKRSTNTVLRHVPNTLATFGPKETANAGAPDKSGRWIIFPLNNNTGAPQIGDPRIKILDLQTNTWQTIHWTGADDSPSHGDVGTGFMIGHGNFSGAANRRSLSNVNSHTLLFDYKNASGVRDWSNDQHMTLYADDESWAMMGLYDDPELNGYPQFETGAYENEIMQFSMTDPTQFRRLLHHRSNVAAPVNSVGYWAIPKPTISRDGRFIAFTSNWENSTGRTDLFIAKIDPPGQSQSGSPVNVTWTNLVNATASGNDLTASAASGRGETTQSIASGNGSIIGTVTLSQPSGLIKFGLANGTFTGNPAEIDYGWKFYDNGVAYPAINDVAQINYIQAANNDTLEVRIEGTSVKWYKNTTLIHTATAQTLSYPYRGVATLSANGNKVLNVRMTGVSAPSPDVTWTNVVNGSVSGSTLTATAASGRGETIQSIASGNGSIIGTVTLSQPSGILRLGLINGTFTGNPAEIDYGWKFYDNGVAYPAINDVAQINYIQAANNDTLEVRIEGTSVKWYKNTTLIYTATGQALSYPYRGAATLSASGNKVLNVKMTGTQ